MFLFFGKIIEAELLPDSSHLVAGKPGDGSGSVLLVLPNPGVSNYLSQTTILLLPCHSNPSIRMPFDGKFRHNFKIFSFLAIFLIFSLILGLFSILCHSSLLIPIKKPHDEHLIQAS